MDHLTPIGVHWAGQMPEYILAMQRLLGAGAEAWLQQARAMLPAMGGMARIDVTPGMGGQPDLRAALAERDGCAMAAATATV